MVLFLCASYLCVFVRYREGEITFIYPQAFHIWKLLDKQHHESVEKAGSVVQLKEWGAVCTACGMVVPGRSLLIIPPLRSSLSGFNVIIEYSSNASRQLLMDERDSVSTPSTATSYPILTTNTTESNLPVLGSKRIWISNPDPIGNRIRKHLVLKFRRNNIDMIQTRNDFTFCCVCGDYN